MTAQQDLFQVESLVTPITLHAVYLSQTSDVGDSSAENLSIRIVRATDAVTDEPTPRSVYSQMIRPC